MYAVVGIGIDALKQISDFMGITGVICSINRLNVKITCNFVSSTIGTY